VGEVGAMTLVCFILEGFIAGGLRHPTFYAWSVVAGFTLIMRVEFFVGDWLSPKMELYGLVHTLSASLIGMLVFSVMTNQSIHLAPLAYIYVVLGNWFVFNVFEIGRKTFGKEEERPSVPSYSTRLKPTGAYLFLAVNILLAFGTLWQACSLIKNVRYPGISVDPFTAMVAAAGGISLMVLIAGALYIQKANAVNGKIYRGVVSLYLLAYHVSIVIIAFIQLR
jgi:4-hydroxybenzoate polyprenyltransferase